MNTTQKIGDTIRVKVNLIDPDPKNRKDHDGEKLKSLAESIKSEGLLEPVLVRPHPEKPGRYMIVAGERRWRAHGIAKLDEIVVRVAESAGVGVVRQRLAENLQREDLTPMEQAQGFRELLVEHKLTQAEVAKIAGVAQPTVANAVRLLDLPKRIQQMLQDGQLTRAHGVTLVRFAAWPKVAEFIADRVVKEGITTKELEEEALPFAHALCRAKLAVHCTEYRWPAPDYVVPAELLKDPAFVGESHDCYCLEPAKWAPEKARQDKAYEQRKKAEAKQEKSVQAKMTPAAAAERKRKIATNRRNRIEATTATADALALLTKAKTIESGMLTAIVMRLLSVGDYSRALKPAAAKLGIDLPAGLVTTSWYTSISTEKLRKLSDLDKVRLTAAAIVCHHGEQAVKFSHRPDEAVLCILPKGAEKTLQRVDVSVKMTGSENLARAGNVLKSNTSSAEVAAREAAARYFGCAPKDVKLVKKQAGSVGGVPAQYVASKGGRK